MSPGDIVTPCSQHGLSALVTVVTRQYATADCEEFVGNVAWNALAFVLASLHDPGDDPVLLVLSADAIGWVLAHHVRRVVP